MDLTKIKSIAFNLFGYVACLILFFVLWFKGCKSETPVKIITVEVPAKSAVLPTQNPVHKEIEKPFSRSQENGKIVYKENPINQKFIEENERIKEEFSKETDSLKKEILFAKVAKLNRFSTNFEDGNLIINIDGIVQGEVKEITPNYTIKAQKIPIEVKPKETVFRLLGGGAVGSNEELNKLVFKLDLGFQNRRGDIISAEYLNIGSEHFGMIGFKKSIFRIKR